MPPEASVLKLLSQCSIPASAWNRTASAKAHRPMVRCGRASAVRAGLTHLKEGAEASQTLNSGKVGPGQVGLAVGSHSTLSQHLPNINITRRDG